MIFAAVLWLSLGETDFDVDTLRVENYTVVWHRDPDYGEDTSWCELRDHSGRVVVRLQDYFCAPLGLHETDAQAVTDFDGDGRNEVVLETWSGGAHGSVTYQVWSLGKSPKCLLAWDKGNIYDVPDGYDFKFEDLDGDGRLEILSWYDGFCYTIAGAYNGLTPIVFALRGGVYRDCTQDFRATAERIWRELGNGASPSAPLPLTKPEERRASVGEQLAILDAWIYEWTQGTKNPKAVLLARCSEQGAAWLKEQDSAIRQCIGLIPKHIAYPAPYVRKPFEWDIDAMKWDWN